jgi:tetratricopeptide (TPR) repeat protein
MPKLSVNRRILYPFLLSCFTLGFFFPALFNGFVYDDHFQLVRNPYVKDFQFLPALFTTDVWHFSPETQSNNYRPLHMVTYLILYKLFGLNPVAFHLANLLLHLGCVLLLWQVLGHYVGEFEAFIGALLFAVHPVHVEPVAWIGGTPELLHSALLMIALLFYIRKQLYWSLIPFAAALWTKEPALVFPGILIVDHWLFQRYPNRKFLQWLLPAGLIMLFYFCARIYALDSFIRFNQVKMDLFGQLYTAISFAGLYASKVLLPIDLKVFYHFAVPLEAGTARAGLLMIGALILLLIVVRKNRSALFGLLWFGILMIPSLFIVGVSPVLFAERYVYLASAGFFLTLVSFTLRQRLQVLLVVLSVVFGLITFERSKYWKDDATLWTEAYFDTPDSPAVNYNLATSYFKAGNCERAGFYYRRVAMLQPNFAGAYYNLANCDYRSGKYEEAAKHLTLFLQHWKHDDTTRKEAIQRLNQLKKALPHE